MARVLHLFNVFGALTEKVFLDYALGLARCGWDITVGHETLAEGAAPTNLRLMQLDRIKVEPTADVPAQMQRIAAAVSDPAMLQLLDEKFDLIHGHFGPRLLQGSAWLKRKTPMILSIYGYDAGRLVRDACWIERYRWAAQQGATFVVLAKYLQDRLLSMGISPERIRLIRLGIDLAGHAYDPQPAPARARFVFIGRFVEKKGADVLIRAMAHLTGRMGVNAELDIIGGGPMEALLRRLAEELGLAEKVRFVGLVSFAKLFDYLHGATALVQPSVVASDGDAEGAPMVLMHAQAAGVSCVTTRHAGNPEVLPDEGQPFVVPERDPVALATAMARMAELGNSHRSTLQQAGRAWIERYFDLRKTVADYDQLYRQILQM